MATSVNDPNGKRPRGRPKKTPISGGTPGERQAADAKASEIIESTTKPKSQSAKAAEIKAGKTHTGPPAVTPTGPMEDVCRGPGNATVSQGQFLTWVREFNKIDADIELKKLELKELNGNRKDRRKMAQGAGIVLGDLDTAMKAAKTERVDLLEQQYRLRFYYQFLGLPTEQADLFEADPRLPTAEQDAQKWYALGRTAGLQGADSSPPATCHTINTADWSRGYTDGQNGLAASMPLTAGAYNADGSLKEPTGSAPATPAPAAPLAAVPSILLSNEHFLPDVKTSDDCSKATLREDMVAKWEAAENVVVYFKDPIDGRGSKRILKRPATETEPAYEDLGAVDGELTDAVPVDSIEEVAAEVGLEVVDGEIVGAVVLEAIAEAEPEIVEQVLEDAEEGGDLAATTVEGEPVDMVDRADDAEFE